ncbi:MAG: PepSY-like domain-containing protein [Bacteroidaceae bacterium]|nr:PepSY-like domain-containing protein [Bacteroidaceae bacterium]
MRTLLVAVILAFSTGVAVVNADNDRVVTKNALPAKAQAFIAEYFAGKDIVAAKEEREFRVNSFEVLLTDGIKLEFYKNGAWKEVDCRNNAVPAGIVPAKITSYVNVHYPGTNIVKIDFDKYDYEVNLSNGLELTFNKRFKIVDVDN